MSENNSSETVGQVTATSNTGASSGSAGSNTTTSASGTTPTPTAVVAPKGIRQDLQQMLQGWQTAIPGDSTMGSSAGSLSQAAVVQRLQSYLGRYQDLDAKVTAAQEARAQVESQLAEVQQYFAVLKLAVTNQLGPKSAQLAQFGLRARKPQPPRTASQLAVQAAKAKATRAMRGTIGARKKAQIRSGSMKFVEPVSEATASTASPVPGGGTEAASTAPSNPSVGAASPPTAEK